MVGTVNESDEDASDVEFISERSGEPGELRGEPLVKQEPDAEESDASSDVAESDEECLQWKCSLTTFKWIDLYPLSGEHVSIDCIEVPQLESHQFD